MSPVLADLVQADGFMPHGYCFLWSRPLLWSYVVSDSVIAAAYYSIPVAVWYFVKKRRDLPFSWIFVLFGVFVMACGTTHLFSIWNIWHPDFWADAAIKGVTAVASIVTAVLLWPLIPKALALPSHDDLRRANEELKAEVERRQHAERELRETNQRLEQRTAELEAANRELEAFSYSVSHDLRAPLRHIDAFSRLLLEETGEISETGTRYLGLITRAANRMGRLIDALLSFSRASRADVSHQTVDLNALVEEARKETQPVGSENVIEWRLGKLPAVKGDAPLLRVVFMNLLSNAVKFAGKRARPTIQVEARSGESEEVIVAVKDNGAGFDQLYQDKLFGVFQRLHREEEFEGTGIGLAMVRRIIEKHGGRVWAEGKVDQGATFFVSLRLA